MSSYLDELNEVQRKAVVNTEGPVLVVAGPGSGKTRVLTYRIAHIIQKGTPPWEILSLTFLVSFKYYHLKQHYRL